MKNIFYILLFGILLISCQDAQDESQQVSEENHPMPVPEQMAPMHSQAGPQQQMPPVHSQDNPQQMQQNPSQPESQMSREERMEQIKMQKIAFMTEELKLNVEESQVFWPVYNQWWEESMKLNHDQFTSFKEISKSDHATMADLETIAKSYEKQAALIRKWGKEFAKVIPEEKVSKVFVTEERFKNYLVRKGPNWGKPQK